MTQSNNQNVIFDGRTTEVVVRRKVGNKIQGRFSAISPLSNKRRSRGIMQKDIFDLLDQVSKGAFTVFNNLKFNRDEENNITRFSVEEGLSKTDREVLSRRLTELKKTSIIRSVKKEIPDIGTDRVFKFKDPRRTFLINPQLIRCTNHDEATYLWDQCS